MRLHHLIWISILLLASGPTASPASAIGGEDLAVIEGSEEDLLILEVQLGEWVLSDGLIAYRASHSGDLAAEPYSGDLAAEPYSVLLPLGEITGLLELPIQVDPAARSAVGWLGQESERFDLDLAAQPPTLDGQPLVLGRGRAAIHRTDIYIEAALLDRWLAVGFELDLAHQVLRLEPRRKLPIQRRLERQERWRQLHLHAVEDQSGPRFAAQQIPYRLLDWPVVDGRYDINRKRYTDGSLATTARHSLLAQGDLLGMTADLFLGGQRTSDEDDLLADARLTLSRRDPQGGLLGPMRATDLRFGDLVSPNDRLISPGHPGRGFELARISQQGHAAGSRTVDRTTLRGDALPGWDIELYRNEVLYDVTTVSDEGRYELADVALFFGINRLKLVFYGPHGERREKVEQIYLGPGLLPRGETDYHFGVYQQDVGLLQRSQALAATDAAVQGDFRLVAGLTRGLTRQLSGDAGLFSLALPDGRHDYLRLGLRAALLGGAGRLVVLHDMAGGSAATLALQRRLGRFTVAVEHSQFQDFVSEEIELADLLSRTEARLDGQIRLFGSRVVPLSLTLRQERHRPGRRLELRGSSGFSHPLGRLHLTHRWHFDVSGSELDASRLALRGNLLFNSWLRQLALRANLRYDLHPSPELASLDLVARWRPGRRLSATFGLDHGLAQGITQVHVGADWELRPLRLGVDLGWGTDGSLRAGASLSFSLGREPRSGRARWQAEPAARQGAVSARVFLDHDGNGHFGPGDEALPGVRFAVNGSPQSLPSNADGVARLALSPYRHADLAVDETSLEDPYWRPQIQGLGFVPRPGVTWTAEFPIAVTGEIDGTVSLGLKQGQRAASKIRLQLVAADGEVLQEVESQYDGFYLFTYVPPGLYTLQTDPRQAEELGLRPFVKPAIRMEGGNVLTLDFDLRPAATGLE